MTTDTETDFANINTDIFITFTDTKDLIYNNNVQIFGCNSIE